MTKVQISTAVSEPTRAKFDALTAKTGKSIAELLSIAADMLSEKFEHYNPQLVIGFIQVDRFGDLNAEDDCSECGQSFAPGLPFMRLHGDGSLSGPVCSRCATSE